MDKNKNSKQKLAAELRERLSDAERIAIVGVGSELKGDDYAGVAIAHQLEKDQGALEKRPDVKIFIGGNAPENITGEIKRFGPSHVIILDCADMGRNAGESDLIDMEKIGGASMDTHRLPMKMFAKYLFSCIECRIIIIGIQPKTLGFNLPISEEVKAATNYVSSVIREVCKF